jgi:5-methylcytosine-specific restriction enzyme A
VLKTQGSDQLNAANHVICGLTEFVQKKPAEFQHYTLSRTMNHEQLETAYPLLRAAYSKEISVEDAVKRLNLSLALNKTSARILILVYVCLREGRVFKRALSGTDMHYILGQIAAETGPMGLATALKAFQLHISYRESHGVSQKGNRQLLLQHEAHLGVLEADEREIPLSMDALHQQFAQDVRKALADPRESRLQRLSSASKVPMRSVRAVFVFNRNPDVVAEVLVRAQGTCEKCLQQAPFLRRSDGTPYLEVHHLVPLAEGGEDSVANAAAMCPNCHRESHFGASENQ